MRAPSYDIAIDDNWIGADGLSVYAHALAPGETLKFDGSAETSASFNITGGPVRTG